MHLPTCHVGFPKLCIMHVQHNLENALCTLEETWHDTRNDVEVDRCMWPSCDFILGCSLLVSVSSGSTMDDLMGCEGKGFGNPWARASLAHQVGTLPCNKGCNRHITLGAGRLLASPVKSSGHPGTLNTETQGCMHTHIHYLLTYQSSGTSKDALYARDAPHEGKTISSQFLAKENMLLIFWDHLLFLLSGLPKIS